MELSTFVKILGCFLCVIGMAFSWFLFKLKLPAFAEKKQIKIGFWVISSLGFLKLLLFAGFFALPASTVVIANYHIFEGTKKVTSCAKCHIMQPFTTDMQNPQSTTLAAKHFNNGWIVKEQCYQCHKDYGLNGTMKAKVDGYRHLIRYVTGYYEEPIRFRGTFNNQNCMQCHGITGDFGRVSFHSTLEKKLSENEVSCLTCHGLAHPKPSLRTPGNPQYQEFLMGKTK